MFIKIVIKVMPFLLVVSGRLLRLSQWLGKTVNEREGFSKDERKWMTLS